MPLPNNDRVKTRAFCTPILSAINIVYCWRFIFLFSLPVCGNLRIWDSGTFRQLFLSESLLEFGFFPQKTRTCISSGRRKLENPFQDYKVRRKSETNGGKLAKGSLPSQDCSIHFLCFPFSISYNIWAVCYLVWYSNHQIKSFLFAINEDIFIN